MRTTFRYDYDFSTILKIGSSSTPAAMRATRDFFVYIAASVSDSWKYEFVGQYSASFHKKLGP